MQLVSASPVTQCPDCLLFWEPGAPARDVLHHGGCCRSGTGIPVPGEA
jgi:hypothetical protein